MTSLGVNKDMESTTDALEQDALDTEVIDVTFMDEPALDQTSGIERKPLTGDTLASSIKNYTNSENPNSADNATHAAVEGSHSADMAEMGQEPQSNVGSVEADALNDDRPEAPAVAGSAVSTSEAPAVAGTDVITSEAPAVASSGVSTSEVPAEAGSDVSTSEAPAIASTDVSTSDAPAIAGGGVSTSEVHAVAGTDVSSSKAPLESDINISSKAPMLTKTSEFVALSMTDSPGQSKVEAAAPNISSYFNKTPDDNPFNIIGSTEKVVEKQPDTNAEGMKVRLPAAEEIFRLQEEDGERLYSPPITKEEMENEDLSAIQNLSVDTSKSSPQEINRMYDAWIPSESTKHFLKQSIAVGGTLHLAADKLLRPRLAMADTQADPVYLETFKLRGERETQKRKHILDLSHVDHTVDGLHKLIVAECWRSALDLTAIILTNMGQGLQPLSASVEYVITPESMKVWAVRIALLTKLRFYSIAEAECQQFGHMDNPQLHFEFYSKMYPGRTGSMVPFSLRLLYACLPQFLGRHNESLDRLFHVRGQVSKILHNLKNGYSEDGGATVLSSASSAASMALWHQRELRVVYSLAACLTDMKDFRLAISIYKDILVRDPENVHFTYSAMARLCLQMGALKTAESYFVLSVNSCKDASLRKQLIELHRQRTTQLCVCYTADSSRQVSSYLRS
ncbi:trafficking protein particle complex subunit 12-like isoform X2 [Watersipora subatra]|uniref:trafficking protein particle complex subunit 12-like isoform X2 n=1 Tax=Watersipora subatra TaxID=2589382 RepID=UPI00355B6B65